MRKKKKEKEIRKEAHGKGDRRRLMFMIDGRIQL